MNVMIISDIHGSFVAMKRVAELFSLENADFLVCCGDYLNHGPRNELPEQYNPKETAIVLNTFTERICGVRGNCDSEVDQMMLEFPCLNSNTVLTESTNAGLLRIFVHHGHISLPPINFFTIVFSGHTHIPEIRKDNGILFCNPGSVAIPKGGSSASYAMLRTAIDGKYSIQLKSLADRSVFTQCNGNV